MLRVGPELVVSSVLQAGVSLVGLLRGRKDVAEFVPQDRIELGQLMPVRWRQLAVVRYRPKLGSPLSQSELSSKRGEAWSGNRK